MYSHIVLDYYSYDLTSICVYFRHNYILVILKFSWITINNTSVHFLQWTFLFKHILWMHISIAIQQYQISRSTTPPLRTELRHSDWKSVKASFSPRNKTIGRYVSINYVSDGEWGTYPWLTAFFEPLFSPWTGHHAEAHVSGVAQRTAKYIFVPHHLHERRPELTWRDHCH